MRSSFDKPAAAGLLAGLLVGACSSSGPLEVPSLPTGPPAPMVVLNVNVSCADCPLAPELRPAWLAALVARCDPDVLMMQELRTQEELDAVAAAVSDYDPFHFGMPPFEPSHTHFEVVTWVRRDGFRVPRRGGSWLSPDPRAAGSKFPEADESHVLAFIRLQDCRTDLFSTWYNAALESNPVVQQKSLVVIAADTSLGRDPLMFAGAFHIAPTDPLYPSLLAPPRGWATFDNTTDLAELRDTSGVPGVDLQTLTDHVLVSTDPAWRVLRWSLEGTSHDGQRISDSPPICTTIQELAPKQSTIPERESCR